MTDTKPAMHYYRAYFNGKTVDVRAPTMYDAQRSAALHFRVGRRAWLVACVLVAKADGTAVALDTASL